MIDLGIHTTFIILGLAIVASLNPCSLGAFILIISVMLGEKKSAKHVLRLGILYIISIFGTYITVGALLISLLSFLNIPSWYLAMSVGLLIIVAGMLEIKDFYWYGKGVTLQTPPFFASTIHKFSKNLSAPKIIILGTFIALIQLLCTGAPYLTALSITSFSPGRMNFILIYNVIFILPLILILYYVSKGTHIQKIQKWKQTNKMYMRLFTGLVLVVLGWILILNANNMLPVN